MPSQISFSRPTADTVQVSLAGAWEMQAGLPGIDVVEHALDEGATPRRLTFDAGGLGKWDSALLTFLHKVSDLAKARHVTLDSDGLPEGVRRLLALAAAVPEKKGAARG
ncbi:MAG: STAS domain-containing protein, partial [Candidatus Binatia bacterium]